MTELAMLTKFLIVAIIMVLFVVLGFITVLQLKKISFEKKQLIENSSLKELLNDHLNKVMVIHTDLAELKEKVNAIEKMLKEVE